MNRIPILTLRHTQVSISWQREQSLLDESTEGGALLPTLCSSCLKFQREESHWCLLDLSGLHIHKGMEKMDMAWCPICSNLILPLSLSSTLSLSVCLTPPHLLTPTPRVHAETYTAGGEGDRQQGSSSQTVASHCMSAQCTIKRQQNEGHMSNDASLSLKYGHSVRLRYKVTAFLEFSVIFWGLSILVIVWNCDLPLTLQRHLFQF